MAEEFKTKSGKVLTAADIDALADEAERGYDVEKIKQNTDRRELGEQWHTCHFCGSYVNQRGFGTDGRRHWLSDCRPDLVEHEPGPLCTWPNMNGHGRTCYAYQDRQSNVWTNEHVHFYDDGPM